MILKRNTIFVKNLFWNAHDTVPNEGFSVKKALFVRGQSSKKLRIFFGLKVFAAHITLHDVGFDVRPSVFADGKNDQRLIFIKPSDDLGRRVGLLAQVERGILVDVGDDGQIRARAWPSIPR